MRRKIFRLEPVDQGEGRNSFRLPFLCRHCVHTMEHGKLFCVQGLELPAYGGFCAGFTLARKTDSNERPQKALPSSVDCCTMGAPNQVRRHKSLSDFPRVGRMLVLHLLSTPARRLARRLHILAGFTTSDFSVRDRRLHLSRGALCTLPFLFPKSSEVFNV